VSGPAWQRPAREPAGKANKGMRNLSCAGALTRMDEKSSKARARAEAHFKVRQQQKADAPVALREYREAQRATLDNMERLRRLRATRAQKSGTAS
jgi:hypothetical protein